MMKKKWIPAVSIFICTLLLMPVSASTAENQKNEIFHKPQEVEYAPSVGTTERVSVASDGTQANFQSGGPSISSDGRYVVFGSSASNLVSGDTNGTLDVFFYDRDIGQTKRVSVSSGGEQGNDASYHGNPSISADGRYVTFHSDASNLVNGDTNGTGDVFVHDIATGQTTLVSVASNGTHGNYRSQYTSISADGRYVAIGSAANNLVSGDTNNAHDIFVHDRETGNTTRVSLASNSTQGNGTSSQPYISANGRYVAFVSSANNLIDGDTNGEDDVFIHDRDTGKTQRVSIDSNGLQGNSISYRPSLSADGRYIAFDSNASNLVSNDTNGTWDVFVHDKYSTQTTRISVTSDITQGNNSSVIASISDDGQFVSFCSNANNLVNGDINESWDVFIHNRNTGQTQLVSVSSDGIQGNSNSVISDISGSGRFITFDSESNNLVSGDTNEKRDVFVRDRGEVEIKSWTLMYYLAGDNDLDTSLTTEYFRISQTSIDDSVNVIVFYDGKHSNSRYTVFTNTGTNGPFWQGELNTGERSTLENFLSWSKANYPAENYGLIISDHGHGLGGVAYDDSSSGDYLTPHEIKEVFTNIGKVDVIYMAACLLANLEIEYQLRGITDYYVGSESLSFGPVNHAEYINQVNETTTPQDLALLMAQRYFNQYHRNDTPSTISAVRMNEVETVAARTSDLATSIRNNWVDTSIFVNQVTDASIIQRFEENGDNIIDNDDRMVDLYHFAYLMTGSGKADIVSAANALMDALVSYVIYDQSWSGSYQGTYPYWDHNNAHDVSFAFPRSRISFYDGDYLDFAAGTFWWNTSSNFISETFEWGPMLVDFVDEFYPDVPDSPLPPEPVPFLIMIDIFLPIIMR